MRRVQVVRARVVVAVVVVLFETVRRLDSSSAGKGKERIGQKEGSLERCRKQARRERRKERKFKKEEGEAPRMLNIRIVEIVDIKLSQEPLWIYSDDPVRQRPQRKR